MDYQPFPHYSAAVWLMTQLRRWNMLKEDVDYKKLAQQVMLATDAAKIMRDLGRNAARRRISAKKTFSARSSTPAGPRNTSSPCATNLSDGGKAGTRPWLASLAIFIVFIAVWHLLTARRTRADRAPSMRNTRGLPARARPHSRTAAIPSPGAVAQRGWELLVNAFDRHNPNNLGIAWHLLVLDGPGAARLRARGDRCRAAGFRARALLPPLYGR